MGDDNPVNSTSGDDDNPDNSTSGDDASSAPIVSCECSLLNPCFCQRDCVVCDNVAPPRGINNGMADGDDCYTAPPLVFERRCKNNDRWKQNQFCMLTCFNSGNSYLGVVCCNAPLPNLNMASLIKDGNPNPTTIVVTGAVDEAPNESISRSQVQRGIIIGTRMPAKFFDFPAQVSGSGEVTFASADRRLRSKIDFSRNLQEAANGSSGFGLKIGLIPKKINSGNALASTFFDMNRSIIFIIICTLYYFD